MNWFTSILTAVSETASAAKLWMQRAWGGQTREQSAVQEAAEIALANKRAAYKRAWSAETQEQYALAMDDLNYWDARLRELLKTSSAKWG